MNNYKDLFDNNNVTQQDNSAYKLQWRDSVVVFLMAVMATFVMSLVLSIAMQVVNGGKEWNYSQYWTVQSVFELILAGIAISYLFNFSRRHNQPFVNTIGINKSFKWQDVCVLLVLMFVLINVSTIVNSWFCQLINYDASSSGVPMQYVTQNIVVSVICVCVLPAICEEVLFRGAIGYGLANNFSQTKAVLLSGALFALFHLNPAQTIHQFAIGCLLMLFVIRNGSIWIAVIGHLFNNLVVLVFALTVDNTNFYQNNAVWIVPVGIVIFASVLVLYLKYFKPTTNSIVGDNKGFGSTNNAVNVLMVCGVLLCLVIWIGALFNGQI